MGIADSTDLTKFLERYTGEVKFVAFWLRDYVWSLYPEANELIYVDALSVAIGFSPTDRPGDKFCSIAVHSNHCNFGFNKGKTLSDSDKILLGTGMYKFIRVTTVGDFPQQAVESLLQEAYTNSINNLKTNKLVITGQTIVKSISAAALKSSE